MQNTILYNALTIVGKLYLICCMPTPRDIKHRRNVDIGQLKCKHY